MLPKLITNILLYFSLLIDVEGQLHTRKRLRQGNQMDLDKDQAGIGLTSGGQRCESMTFSLPKPETGCCGVHKFDESILRTGKRIYKRNIRDDEISDDDVGDDDLDLNEDGDYYQYEYDTSELENDTVSESRRKREIIDRFKNPPNEFIVAGRVTGISQYPWMVHLEILNRGRQTTISCGGSLINSKYVLTAGHCIRLEFVSLNDVKIVLAEFDTRTQQTDCVTRRNGQQQCVDNVMMNPEQIIMHPQEFIRPICLPPFNIDTPRNRDLELIVAGWGSVYQGSPGYPIKRSATVNLVPFQECRLLSPVPSEMLCAIGHYGQDACHGDSGGPLMAYYNGNYFLVGIVSGKYVDVPCGSRVPTSYVNVHLYLNWIQSVIKPY